MDDLNSIAVVEIRLLPIVARNNLLVQLDGNSLRGEFQSIDQVSETQRRVNKFTFLAVDSDTHDRTRKAELCAADPQLRRPLQRESELPRDRFGTPAA